MKNVTKPILFVLTALLMFLPLFQEHLRIFHFQELTGVVAEKPQPDITLAHFWDQSLQKWIESHLKLNYGMREPLTRLYNQYQWDCYRESNMVKQKKIYISEDGWIYETGFVEEYYQGKSHSYGKDSTRIAFEFNEEVFRLYQLQHLLEPHGTKLFVMMLPGKELIYPEHIPQTSDFQGIKEISAWEFYGKRFKEMGINYFDVGQWFLEIKDQVDYSLYPQTGTHWSNYAAMHVADSLIRYMEQLGDRKIAHFTIGERYEKTVYPDDDLEQLMNLIRPLPKAPNYYAKTSIDTDSIAERPVIITIGDSYYWNILNATPFGKIMGGVPYWYYFNTVYFDDQHRNIKDVDVMEQVLDADYVMLAYCTSQIYKMSQGFSQQLLLELCCDEEDLIEARQQLAKNIRNNRPWMEALAKKSELYDIPMDTVVKEEAKNSILKSPELFVPALKDSIPTHRSRRYLHYLETKKQTQPHGLQ